MDCYSTTTTEQEMNVIKPHYKTKSSVNKPSLHSNSHTISKFKPKIRIIHIIAPEIIKTDATNFRELVQRLTGKPSEQIDNLFTATNKNVLGHNRNNVVLNSFYHHVHNNNQGQQNRFFPCSLMDDDHATTEEGLKVDEGDKAIWGVEKTESLLHGFTELDNFIQEMVEFPLLPF